MTLFPFKGYEIAPDGTITKFIRIGIETLASKKGTSKYFYHNDHLGGVNVITDINGAQAQLNEYDPWGAVSKSVGNIDQTHRFTGQELDPESGLYYYVGRYYDQEISRFISPDPFVRSPVDPQNLNRYSCVLNSPQNYIDPTGYEYGDSGGSYSIPLYGWVKFFMDLFSSGHKPQPRPKLQIGAAATPHYKIEVENGGQGKLKGVCVYDSQCPEGSGYPNQGTGNAGNDYPGQGSWYNRPCVACWTNEFDSARRPGSNAITIAQASKTISINGITFDCENENAPCRVTLPQPKKPDVLTIKIDQKVDQRCEQCKIDGRIPERGCNTFGGTCDASGKFTPRNVPPGRLVDKPKQSLPEILQQFVEGFFGRDKGAAEDY